MSGLRVVGMKGDATPAGPVYPGDTLLLGESLVPGAIATAGAGTLTGAAIASGIITRTGPVGGYTDTTDTSTNILAALAGNNPAADIAPGTTFRFVHINTVAQTCTFAAGVGVVLGTGGSAVTDNAASRWREYLVTILNGSPQEVRNCGTTNGNKVITFALAPGQSSIPYNVNGVVGGTGITPGMTVSGTGITAGTKVLGVTQGQGGVTGVTTDTNSTATSAAGGVSLTFLPTIQIDGLGSGTL